ncbi:MAG TPA: hypothetical protein GX506_01100 [Firmicutes bacterium]|nr:hypothetical protein [Bacillota bacterium]
MVYQLLDATTLEDMLSTYHLEDLKQLLRLARPLIEGRLPTRKDDIVAVLCRLMSRENLPGMWRRLTDLQKAAVAEVLYSPINKLDKEMFKAKYGNNEKRDEHEFHRDSSREDNEDGLRSGYLPLFIGPDGRMPLDLREALRSFVKRPADARVETLDDLPEMPGLKRVETARQAIHELPAILRLVEMGKIRVSATTQRVTAAGIREITRVLFNGDFYPAGRGVADHAEADRGVAGRGEVDHRASAGRRLDEYQPEVGPIRAFAWPLLLQAGNLAAVVGGKLGLTSAGRKALNAPPHEILRSIWRRWLKTTIIDEFSRIEAIKGQRAKGGRHMTAPSGRRAAIAEALAEVPVGEWIGVEEFGRFMRASGHMFEVTRNEWNLYVGDPQYGSLGYAGFGGWNILQGRYLMVFLLEYVATLGMVDVAYTNPEEAPRDFGNIWGTDDLLYLSRYDGLRYIRLNNLGAYCLELVEDYAPEPEDERRSITVLPNREIIAPPQQLLPTDELLLARFARKTSESAWSMDLGTILAAVEGGLDLDEIRRFLTVRSKNPLPDTVRDLLEDAARRLKRLTDCGQARLIEADDPALALEIVNNSSLRGRCLLAGERYIVVPSDSEGLFRSTLRELGYILSGASKV